MRREVISVDKYFQSLPGDSSVPVSGFLGEQVVLPCTYKGNVPVSDLLAVWVTAKSEILHKFIAGNDDLTEQDPRFRNRTNLFKDQLGQGNWSVLISDLKETDQNQYICHIYKRIAAAFVREQTDIIHLSVTERVRTPVPNTPVPNSGLCTRARVGLGIGIPVLLVAVIVVWIFQTRQRWISLESPDTPNLLVSDLIPIIFSSVLTEILINSSSSPILRNRHSNNRNEASKDVPLTEVTCPDETRGLVTTAPEHQDGAAGEQNLLGNRTVQHRLSFPSTEPVSGRGKSAQNG
ncbi:V-set domain-containing T-cell activation inhibitor 1-like [Cetorhinus maximus]